MIKFDSPWSAEPGTIITWGDLSEQFTGEMVGNGAGEMYDIEGVLPSSPFITLTAYGANFPEFHTVLAQMDTPPTGAIPTVADVLSWAQNILTMRGEQAICSFQLGFGFGPWDEDGDTDGVWGEFPTLTLWCGPYKDAKDVTFTTDALPVPVGHRIKWEGLLTAPIAPIEPGPIEPINRLLREQSVLTVEQQNATPRLIMELVDPSKSEWSLASGNRYTPAAHEHVTGLTTLADVLARGDSFYRSISDDGVGIRYFNLSYHRDLDDELIFRIRVW